MYELLIVEQLGKHFNRFDRHRPRSFKEFFMGGFRWGRAKDRFWALRGLSFSVGPGRTLGIIGANGSGKSTLLRLLGNVLRPDEGTVKVRGRIGALIDLGVGFHPDMTGRENVMVAGVIGGLTRSQVLERFDSMVSFAELEEFIDSPYRTYSAGMQMRLAFAVAVHVEPDVLLIDEVLAVGDLAFQNKCLERISDLKSRGCAMVMVSHDIEKVKQFSDEALWLRPGRKPLQGEPEMVAGAYVAAMSHETSLRTPNDFGSRRTASGRELRVKHNRFGSLEMEILDVRLTDPHGTAVSEIQSGGPLCIEIRYLAPRTVSAPVFGVNINSDERLSCVDINTDSQGGALPDLRGEGAVRLWLERLDLNGGEYFVDVGVYEQNWKYAYDFHWHVYPLGVRSKVKTQGALAPPHRWELLV